MNPEQESAQAALRVIDLIPGERYITLTSEGDLYIGTFAKRLKKGRLKLTDVFQIANGFAPYSADEERICVEDIVDIEPWVQRIEIASVAVFDQLNLETLKAKKLRVVRPDRDGK